MATKKETLNFQTEVKQLLHLMIHSLYSNKEIAIRELISNASDASDKLRFEALNNNDLYEGNAELKINVDYDKEKRTITVTDNGIGMDKDEIIANIGTIARSGTKEFLGKLSGDEAKDAHLIGQFGVGFYSAFIIADEVVLETKKAGQKKAFRWHSKGDGEFSIEDINKKSRGTSVTLHLKKTEDEFLAVNYTEIVPILINAVQEQQQMIDTLKMKLQEKETAAVSVEKRVEKLEKLLLALEQ